MPDVGIQIPPNLSDWWLTLVREGATDLGGLSANGDHISPEHPFPSPHQVRKRLQPEGYALTERLCVYPQYIDPEWMAQGVLDTIKLKYWSFIPRRGSGRRQRRADPRRPRAAARSRRRATTSALTQRGADRAVRGAAPGGDRGHAPRGRRAARAARRRHRHVRRQPQHQLHEHLPGRLRLLRLRPGQALARRLPRRRGRLRRARCSEAVDFGVTEICMQGGIHPDYTLEDYGRWLQLAKEVAPAACTCTRTRRWRCTSCASARASRREEVFEYLIECGLGSTPGTAAEVLHDGVRERISPNKLPSTAGSRSSRPRTAPACARP